MAVRREIQRYGDYHKQSTLLTKPGFEKLFVITIIIIDKEVDGLHRTIHAQII